MTMKKNWLYYITLILFEICAIYALFGGILSLGLRPNPYIQYAAAISILAGLIVLAHLAAVSVARLKLGRKHAENGARGRIMETAVAIAALAAGTALRIWAIRHLPVEPASDFQTYYNIAELLTKGPLANRGYTSYIAAFPHVFGYPFVLSLIFRITGPSLTAGLYLNALAGMLSVFIAYRIARLLGGRVSSMIVLISGALWPSQILYGSILAAEPIFTCLLLLIFWIFVHFIKYPVTVSTIDQGVFLCCVLGFLLALASAVRPMAAVLLIAFIICLVPCKTAFDVNEKMLNGRISRSLCQGWFRALIILLVYVTVSQLITASISHNIGYRLPGAATSFGYNFMVGVNIDANGAWNAPDAQFFNDILNSTNSAEAAHRAGIELALGRIRQNPTGVIELAMKKFMYLWANDDYAASWVLTFMAQQERLTEEIQSTVKRFSELNNFMYYTAILFSAVYGIQLARQKHANASQAFILLLVGTVLLHLILETQNRYHYFILPVFMILGALGLGNIFKQYLETDTP